MNTKNNISLSEVIKINKENCINCHSCIRVCPVKYCNDGSGDYIKIKSDLCIGCGRCINVCSHSAREYIDNFDIFIEKIEKKEPLIALVAPSIAANYPHKYLNLNGWFKEQGIEAIFDVSFGAELTTQSYANYLNEESPELSIAQACPVTINYSEIYKPELIKYLAPIDSPMVHSIKFIKEFYPQYKDHAIAVISPCLAKKREFDELPYEVLNIVHFSLQKYLEANNINLLDYEKIDFDDPNTKKAVKFCTTGELTKAIENSCTNLIGKTRSVEGENVFNYLSKLPNNLKRNPETLPKVIDCVNCLYSCAQGPLSSTKNQSIDEVDYLIKERFFEQEKAFDYEHAEPIDKYWNKNLYKRKYINRSELFSYENFDDQEKWKILYNMQKFSEDDLYNCGACGYETCEAMALAIHRGLNKPENCHNFLLSEYYKDLEIIKKESNELEKLKKSLEERVHQRTLKLEEQKEELLKSRKIALSLIEDSEIAQRKLEEINQILKEEKQKAQQANAAKSNFLANMSHELRTPLNGVLGFIQLLEDTPLNEEQKDFIVQAQKSSQILLYVINDILNYSKIEAGQMKIKNTDFNLPSLVEDIVTLDSISAYQNDIDINVLIDPNVPEFVHSDPNKITQVINNLVNNAIKFTHSGEIVVSVKTISESENSTKILFAVQDTGIGISKEDQKKVFDSFTQADLSSTRSYGGTGLGLSICKKIIEHMNGEISMDSEKGKGTVVSFILDLERNKKPKNPKCKKYNLSLAIASPSSTALAVFKSYLDFSNCKVDIALSKENLNNTLQTTTPDAIIIDEQMIANDDYKYIEDLKQNEKLKDIPIVLYYPQEKISIANKLLKTTLDEKLAKPLRRSSLNQVLDKIAQKTPKQIVSNNKKQLKVLVAEDNKTNIELISKIFEKENIEYDIAKNGKEAIEIANTNIYDLILMDCQMPIIDGYEAAKLIRKKEKNNQYTPILALTAYQGEESVKRAKASGIDKSITKPLIKNDLIQIIKDMTNGFIFTNKIYTQIQEATELENEEIHELFCEFFNDTKQLINDLEQCTKENNFKKIEDITHKLKGMSANLRLDELLKLSTELEATSKLQSQNECSKISIEIEHYIDRLEEAIST